MRECSLFVEVVQNFTRKYFQDLFAQEVIFNFSESALIRKTLVSIDFKSVDLA